MAVKQSYWRQDMLGDLKDGVYCSRTLLQIRRAEDGCGGWPHTWTSGLDSTAYAADYAGAILRFHYDGQSWLSGSTGNWRRVVQSYFCGCANDGDEPYVNEVYGHPSGQAPAPQRPLSRPRARRRTPARPALSAAPDRS
jgi:hypothetical protein